MQQRLLQHLLRQEMRLGALGKRHKSGLGQTLETQMKWSSTCGECRRCEGRWRRRLLLHAKRFATSVAAVAVVHVGAHDASLAEAMVQRIQDLMQETQTAFVVFKTRQARASAATGLLHADGAAWKVFEAPAPNEVIWENISLPPSQELVGSLLAWGALITIIVFFIPIILFLQQIVNLVRVRTAACCGLLLVSSLVRQTVCQQLKTASTALTETH